MSTDVEVSPRKRWLNKCLLALAVVLVILAAVGVHYRHHIAWLCVDRPRLGDVPAIPDKRMPDQPVPEDWGRCSVGRLELSLPKELIGDRQDVSRATMFRHGSRAVVVSFPRDVGLYSADLEAASSVCPLPKQFTMPQLRRACNQVSSDDFRWSMTPDQVRWHTFLIATSSKSLSTTCDYTESFSRQEFDGIVEFTGNDDAVLYWHSTSSNLVGYLNFDHHDENIDPSWIRAVCRSLKVTAEIGAKSGREP